MATSGSINFSASRDDIINAAFRKLGLKAEGEALSSEQVTDAAFDLNMMIKNWKADGINLWCYQEVTLFPVVSQESFTLGSDRAAVTYVKTEIATAAVSGASTITVDSDDGITSGDFIGVELDDGTLHWTTVSGAPASNVITLTSVLTDDVSVDNHVYAYTTLANRPLRISAARWENSDGTETPLFKVGREDYFNLSTKSSSGNPASFYYDPQLSGGKLYIWQTFSNVKQLIHLTTERAIEDFDISTDNPDFPQEWYLPLVYNLAVILADDYNISDAKMAMITSKADAFYDRAMDYDREDAPIIFTPWGDR